MNEQTPNFEQETGSERYKKLGRVDQFRALLAYNTSVEETNAEVGKGVKLDAIPFDALLYYIGDGITNEERIAIDTIMKDKDTNKPTVSKEEKDTIFSSFNLTKSDIPRALADIAKEELGLDLGR